MRMSNTWDELEAQWNQFREDEALSQFLDFTLQPIPQGHLRMKTKRVTRAVNY